MNNKRRSAFFRRNQGVASPTYSYINNPVTGFYGSTVSDSGFIYFCPYNATVCMKLNPTTGVFTTFGTLPAGSKYAGIIKAPNGKLYCLPYNATNVLVIDTTTDTFTTIGSISGTGKHVGGCLHSDGCIYSMPFRHGKILKIDPSTSTVSTIGTLSTSDLFTGSVLGSDNLIYGIPYSSTQIIRFDPSTSTISYFGSISGTAKNAGGFLGFNNKIYGAPRSSGSWIEIDYLSDLVSVIGSGHPSCQAAFLVPNGTGYGGAYIGAVEFTIITPSSHSSINENPYGVQILSMGGCIAPDGFAYTCPFSGSLNVAKIGNIGSVSPSDFLIPLTLSDLPSSNYNRYLNSV